MSLLSPNVRQLLNSMYVVTFDHDCEDYAVYNRERTFQISAFYDIKIFTELITILEN